MVSINNQSNVIDMLHNIYFQCTCMTKHYSDMIVMASQISGKSITCLCFQQDNTQVRIAAFCDGNSSVTGGLPSQRVSNAERVSMSWRHHVTCLYMPPRSHMDAKP